MNELQELYQAVILDHNKHPRNFGDMQSPTHTASGHNPLCGDRIQVFMRVDDKKVLDIKFSGDGCAISKASASLMTEALRGLTLDEVESLFQQFHHLVTDGATDGTTDVDLGKLQIFAGVREFPMRVKCATLSWHAVRSALASGNTASTE